MRFHCGVCARVPSTMGVSWVSSPSIRLMSTRRDPVLASQWLVIGSRQGPFARSTTTWVPSGLTAGFSSRLTATKLFGLAGR